MDKIKRKAIKIIVGGVALSIIAINFPKNTELTIEPTSVEMNVATSTTFTGYLKDFMGNGIEGKIIRLYLNGVEITNAKTSPDGSYSIPVHLDNLGEYDFQVKYWGD